MAVINVLTKQVAELIAAGEVIERPASVIKELVENAIDAHASSITVEIKNGGVTFMRVADNGDGIEKDDVKNAFLRHATSKIAVQDDLDSIATLGFRGEALASICAVSRVELMTKSRKEPDGTLYRLDGGEEKEFMTIGCPQGTTFIVRDLFYNVPARMKFLKKDSSESNSISSLIDRMALSHPEISFTLIRDGKQVLKTSGNGKLDTAVLQVFGRQFYSGLIPVSYEYQGIELTGYISKPTDAVRASRSMQTFFVNGRYVRTKTGIAALEQAYKGFIMVGKYPACVLSMKMNCSTLDVNVHPAKLEIRFTNERPVYDCIYHGVRTALSEYDTRNNAAVKPDIQSTNPKLLGRTADKGSQLGFLYGKDTINSSDEPEVFMPSSADFGIRVLNDPATAAQSYYTSGRANIRPINLAEHINSRKSKLPAVEDGLTPAADERPPIRIAAETPEIMARSGVSLVPDIITQADEDDRSELLVAEENNTVTPAASGGNKASLSFSGAEYSPADTAAQAVQQDAPAVEGAGVAIVDSDKRELPKRYIGEAFAAYLIIEYGNDRLMFIDKHAAHERLIYEKLKKNEHDKSMQLLLEPVTVTLDKGEYEAVIENRELLERAGFDAEEFGRGMVLLRGVPLFLEKLEITEAFLEIAQYLKTHKKLVLSEKMEWIYQNTACRAAIKAGNKNKPEELIELALELERNPQVRYCPHGRPIYFFMTKSELEKGFKRI